MLISFLESQHFEKRCAYGEKVRPALNFFCQYGSNLITNLKTTKANLSLKDVSLANTASMSHMVSNVRKLSN